MTAGPISRQLMPPKRRLIELQEQLEQLRLQAKVAAGVTVLRIRSCEHEEVVAELQQSSPITAW